jgi:alkanesulfonate monooxygenase SsuD/methylene tetrahydromethanopterin reductase-like flavin-dependent oxidoreductase (luciferase family)
VAHVGVTAAFGVQGSGPLVGEVPAPDHFRRIAETAEAAGFASLWAGDHVAFHEPLLDVTVALTTFAAATERIRLGAGVLLLPLRAPALVAREFASLDYVSGGRVILGVGVGGEHPADFEAVGVPVRERGRRTDASMRMLRELFVAQAPAPAQPNGPPLWVGGRSEAALRRANHLGDGWMPIWVSPQRYAEGLAALGAERARAVVLPALVGGTVEEARRYLSRRYATEFSTHAIERYCVVGPPAQCAERAAEYVEAGAEHVVFHPAVEPHRLAAQIELLGEVAGVAAAR